MDKLTDNDIAEIGSKTSLRILPDLLCADQWNNIEPGLIDFAKKCIASAKNEWISVETRLPEKLQLVIIDDGHRHAEFGQYHSGLFWSVFGPTEIKDVIHWMPLPKPPGV